ncbi:MAG: translation initiation factor IF-2 [Syntrophomonadaceae bacterium]|nr:translation initiation factor IF-2 [Syntrophomonadaceae bacterium]
MAKIRVYELAKELKLTTQEIMRVLSILNISVKTHMSTLEDDQIKRIRDHLIEIQKPMPKPVEGEKKREVPPTPKVEVRPQTEQKPDIRNNQAATGQPRFPQEQKRFDQNRNQTGPVNPQAKPFFNRTGERSEQARPVPNRFGDKNEPNRTSPNRPGERPDQGKPYPNRSGDRPGYGGQPRTPFVRNNQENERPIGFQGQANKGPGTGFGASDRMPLPPSQQGSATWNPTNKTQQQPFRDQRQGPKPAAPAASVPGKGLKPTPPAKGGKPEQKARDTGEKSNNRRTRPNAYQDFRKKDIVEIEGKFKSPRPHRGKLIGRNETPSIKKITIGDFIIVQDLAKKMGKSASDVIKKLMALGSMVTINQEIDAETATLLANEFGVEVEVKSEKAMAEVADIEDEPETLENRSPVVTIMGHVDHGKTSLLDAIRQTNVTATEAGGITQHIGAYQAKIKDKTITFLDTPGHAAFTAMRARGAQVTDIAVLVVAADDGVMPQTIEALNHAKAAGVPIIVAVNKVDKPEANSERVKQQLTEYGLVAEEWGGDTIFAEVSALKKQGLENLLEMILLIAEVMELKANPRRLAKGIVVEAELDKGRGPVATMLVQKGTLKIGDGVIVGTTSGKVRAMLNYKGERIKEAGPSVPVLVVGLSEVPQPGDIFQVLNDERQARDIAGHRHNLRRAEEMQKTNRVRLDELFKRLGTGEVKELNIVLKADVLGSAEAICQSLERLSTPEVKVNIIHNGVGAISETDIMLAAASNAIVIGFNVRPDANARRAADSEHVDIRLYRIIYEAIDDVKAAMSGLLTPVFKEVVVGRAEIRQVFKVPKAGTVAGSYVSEGKINNKNKLRIIRDGVVIHEGTLGSLRRFKEDVREVSHGYECGIGIERFNDIKEGDIIEAFIMEEVRREL